MTALYVETPLLYRTLMYTMLMLTVFGAIYLLVEICMQRIGKRYAGLAILLLSVITVFFQGINSIDEMLDGSPRPLPFSGRLFIDWSWGAVLGLTVLFAVAEILFLLAVRYRRQDLLTVGAIKESLDKLPDGVCFSATDGQPLLVNRQMNEISAALFGSTILNAELFRHRLIEKEVPPPAKVVRSRPTIILEMPDGKVWDLHFRALQMGRRVVCELVAYDVSEQWELTRVLTERNRRLLIVNKRLKKFSEEMVPFTAEKELLDAKVVVHDNIGRALLAWRSYQALPEAQRDREKLLFLWRYVFVVLKKEAAPAGEWDMLEETAEMLNITIEIDGDLPENMKMRTAIITAIRECLTNTAEHAGGDKLMVKVRDDGKRVSAELTNTGRVPAGEVRETGGLSNLRQVVEMCGGTMQITSRPRFRLKVEFVRKEEDEWMPQEYWW